MEGRGVGWNPRHLLLMGLTGADWGRGCDLSSHQLPRRAQDRGQRPEGLREPSVTLRDSLLRLVLVPQPSSAMGNVLFRLRSAGSDLSRAGPPPAVAEALLPPSELFPWEFPLEASKPLTTAFPTTIWAVDMNRESIP